MLIGHKQQWSFLKSAIANERLPQAFLFSGEENLGKKKTAFEFVKMIFCQSQNAIEKPCGVCQSCLLVEKNRHPDFIFISSQSSDIQVDQIRDLQKQISTRPVMGKIKTVIINNAHFLNTHSQNCFLKTLEEPQSQTVFILISNMPDVLLPTIRSRCETIKFYPLTKQAMQETAIDQEILDFSQGKPGLAISLNKNQGDFLIFQNSFKTARNFLKNDLLYKFLFLRDFFPKKEISPSLCPSAVSSGPNCSGQADEKNEANNKKEECAVFLDCLVFLLRGALWQRAGGDAKPSALLKTKNAIQLTQEAKMLLQTTNVNPRLLMENLILQF